MIVCTLVVAPLAHEDVWMMYVFISVVAVAMFGHRGLIVAAGLTLVGMFLPPLVPSWHAGVQWSPAFTIPLVSLALFAFFAVVRANAELTEAKSEIARLATEGERNRIARDLHDLLGHSLTSITIKAGLARRLSATDADAAATEIAEVETLARGALADVRAAVGGYRDVTLASELATGREVLRAAGIEARFPGAIDTVEVAYRALFGWVVREGVTNVVRHSGATSCDITLGASWLAITDDGIGGDHASGNGLSGLRERVEAAGGRLESGARAEGGWRVRATMSAPEPPVDHDRAAMAAATTPELTR
ncbi:MAG: sensor histidine kinase [Actinobacteria bacterium]|nr:sensor histidine kinase [Actinomycetota bacterium]